MRVQVEDTEINGASVAVRRHLTPITGADVSPDERENVSENREMHLNLTHNSRTYEYYSEYHSSEYCHSPIPPPKSKVGGYIG